MPDELKPCFTVIDNDTGKEPCCEEIAVHEQWAMGLVYYDIEGFYLDDEGYLYLGDETGHMVSCPDGRFTVHFTGEDALAAQVARLTEALTIQKNANRLHHDWDEYLFNVCEWGLGERDDKPEWKDEE